MGTRQRTHLLKDLHPLNNTIVPSALMRITFASVSDLAESRRTHHIIARETNDQFLDPIIVVKYFEIRHFHSLGIPMGPDDPEKFSKFSDRCEVSLLCHPSRISNI